MTNEKPAPAEAGADYPVLRRRLGDDGLRELERLIREVIARERRETYRDLPQHG